VIAMLLLSRKTFRQPLTIDIRISAYCWALYLLLCFLSLANHPAAEVLPSYRLLVDGMLMPPLFGLYAMRFFPFLENVQKLHTCACILGIGLFITGLIEFITGIDLFPWVGSEPMFTDTHVRRAEGPFEQQIVLTVVAILLFFFIAYLRRVLPRTITPSRAMLNKIGLLTAFGAALLPLNRGLVLILIPICLIDMSSPHRLFPRKIWPIFFGAVLITAVTTRLLDPRLYDDRVSRPDNFYQRLAQHHETLRVVHDYPLLGVGFGLYHDVALRNPVYMAKWEGIESMNFPHNVLMTVLSEQGAIGLSLYVLAQFFLVRAMWKIRKAFAPGWLAFLYCFLAYVLTGLDYATVYFADINLFYLLVLGLIYQLQLQIHHENESAVSIHDPSTLATAAEY
jgi:O-Antigen ligase